MTRYIKSEALLDRALKTIPLGTQTFSKSKTQYPRGVSPYYIVRGEGSHVWDADGNKYVDFINGLASITLGYKDPDVTAAVQAQMEDGVIFSLPHPIEIEAAEKITEMVPCAEMVRFGKNGSDATSGAIRLARAYTRRDRVAVCGYHGWQDWYIGSTPRNKGVPKAVQALTHGFNYNDIESLHKLFCQYPNEFAAVIMEPMNTSEPQRGFLTQVAEMARSNGALFILDETITGFRYANGGAQEYFGVTPDLATLGKGLANGYPVSAVVGKAEIMQMMEEIFFSFTFGGEALSLAAACATMTKLQKEPVIETLAKQGQKIFTGVQAILRQCQLDEAITISGHPSWSFLNIKDCGNISSWEIKTLFLQELFNRGFLSFGTHNMSYSHSDEDLDKLLSAYQEIFPLISKAIHENKLADYLRCEPLVPLFKLR